MVTCPQCAGSGGHRVLHDVKDTRDGVIRSVRVHCGPCDGTGQVNDDSPVLKHDYWPEWIEDDYSPGKLRLLV